MTSRSLAQCAIDASRMTYGQSQSLAQELRKAVLIGSLLHAPILELFHANGEEVNLGEMCQRLHGKTLAAHPMSTTHLGELAHYELSYRESRSSRLDASIDVLVSKLAHPADASITLRARLFQLMDNPGSAHEDLREAYQTAVSHGFAPHGLHFVTPKGTVRQSVAECVRCMKMYPHSRLALWWFVKTHSVALYRSAIVYALAVVAGGRTAIALKPHVFKTGESTWRFVQAAGPNVYHAILSDQNVRQILSLLKSLPYRAIEALTLTIEGHRVDMMTRIDKHQEVQSKRWLNYADIAAKTAGALLTATTIIKWMQDQFKIRQ